MTSHSPASNPELPKLPDLGPVYIPDDQGPEDVRYVREDRAIAAVLEAGSAAAAQAAPEAGMASLIAELRDVEARTSYMPHASEASRTLLSRVIAALAAHETSNASDNGACVQPASGEVAEAGQVARALDDLEGYHNRESVGFEKVQILRAALAATPASPQAPAVDDEQRCQELRALGWQVLKCPACGADGAVGYPRAAPQAVVGEASEKDDRLFDMTLECVGRAVEVTFNREQISALVERLSAFGLLTPSPAPSVSPHQGADALREALAEFVAALDEKRSANEDLMQSVETAERSFKVTERIWANLEPARAALAHHQAPQQGEQQ